MGPETVQHITKAAQDLYAGNRRSFSLQGKEYTFVCPSPKYYGSPYLWDGGLDAIAQSNVDMQGAIEELRALLVSQRSDGFLPCETVRHKQRWYERKFQKPYMDGDQTRMTQPPVIAISLKILMERGANKMFIQEAYPKISLFLQWLYEHRNHSGNNLLRNPHPYEHGMDSTPSGDQQFRIEKNQPGFIYTFRKMYNLAKMYEKIGWNEEKIWESGLFSIQNVSFNTIYALALLSMRDVANALEKPGDAAAFQSRYDTVRQALLTHSWSQTDKIFYDLDHEGKRVLVKTVSSLMPLTLPDMPTSVRASLVSHLTNPREFWTPYPIPSVAVSEPTFNPDDSKVLWRGPTWVNTNWFIAKALVEDGDPTHRAIGEKIAEKTTEMVHHHGFREFYHPFTGKGGGQESFAWSTLVLDMFSTPYNGR